MSVPKGHEADLDALLTDFLARHGGTASFDSFRHCWHASCARRRQTHSSAWLTRACACFSRRRQRSHFSCIHEARPLASAVEQYTQALFATALARLGCSPAAEAGAVDANDAGVLYALLLLFWTQRCSPRVHIYLPLSAWLPLPPTPWLLALTSARRVRHAGKVARLQRLISQAVQVEHADILRVFRVLLTEAALVPGCVTPSEVGHCCCALRCEYLPSADSAASCARASTQLQAAFSQRPAAAATCSAVVQAAEEHLLSGLYGALACDSLVRLMPFCARACARGLRLT